MGPFAVHIQPSEGPGDAAIATLAGTQHGVVAHWQLLALGLGREAIKYRARSGRLHRLYPGVYAVGHTVLSLRGRWMAAVLACGPDAVLSHYDAALLWGVVRGGYGSIHVTVSARGRKGHEGIRLHRVRTLDPADWGYIENIPVTSLPRTLLDLAEILTPHRLVRAIEEAERLHAFDLGKIHDVIARNRGRRGSRPLIAGCEAALEEARHTKTEFERLLLEICSEAGLPLPAMNVTVEGEEVDAHWPGTTLIVELDSWEWHRTRQAFERDRAKI